MNEVIDRKLALQANISAESNQRRGAFNGDAKLAQKSYEEEEVEIEAKSRDFINDFKNLMKMNRLFS